MTYEQSLTVPHPVRLTVDEFMLLERSGAFDRYAKSELIDGTIYVVNSQFSEHMVVKNKFYRRLADACDHVSLEAWSEGSVDMSPDSLPEPDLLVTNARPTTGAVKLSTVVLLGEVADTSLASDLGIKAALYAAKQVPEYWVVDVQNRTVHQLWEAGPEGYRQHRSVPFGERLEAATIAGLSVETDALI